MLGIKGLIAMFQECWNMADLSLMEESKLGNIVRILQFVQTEGHNSSFLLWQ